MNLAIAVLELFPCLLRAKQNEIKELKETSKQDANTRRQIGPLPQLQIAVSFLCLIGEGCGQAPPWQTV